jgi:glutamate--cysteine ligase
VVLGLGCHPLATLDEIPWVPKQRYRIMREYMTRVGTLGHRMMKQTATVQANLDFADERDAMRKLRIGMATAPIMNALFANSPLVDGDLSGFASFRGQVWTDTDRARCGILPFVFRNEASFADYVAWALDVPMYFLLRDGRYVTEVTGIPFRRLLDGGVPGIVATMDDWNLHLTTLFPEVRLKGFIELRAADSQPPERVMALPALAKGIFYDADCQDAAFDLVRSWSPDQCTEAYRDALRGGFAARLRGIRIAELARELLAIAYEGLKRTPTFDDAGRDERCYLDPIAEQLARGQTRGEEIAGLWRGAWAQEPAALLQNCGLR